MCSFKLCIRRVLSFSRRKTIFKARHALRAEDTAGNLAALALVLPGNAPAHRVPRALIAGADDELARIRIDEHLHVHNLVQSGNAGVVEGNAVAANGQRGIKLMGEKLPAHHLIALEAEARLRGNARGFLAFLPAEGLNALAGENLRSIQQRICRRLLRALRRILSGLRRIRGARRLPEGLRVSAGAARRERAAAVGILHRI